MRVLGTPGCGLGGLGGRLGKEAQELDQGDRQQPELADERCDVDAQKDPA